MFRRMGRKLFNIFAFDLESHNDSESLAKKETSMWLGCLLNEDSKIDDEDSYLYSIKEFADKLDKLSNPKRKHNEKKRPCKNLGIYIYNLSFEASFLLPELLRRGFKWKEDIKDNDELVYNSVSTPSASSVWSMNIKFGRKNGLIVLKDLAKIFGGGLGKVAKSFGLETQKGEIDYRKNRLHNYKITKEEKEYCFKDTFIIVEILKIMNDRGDKNFWNSSSMATYSMKMLLDTGYPYSYFKMKKFREDYPNLSEEEDTFLRKSVEGGLCYPTPRFQFKNIQDKEILHIDIHQAYPNALYRKLFPYGKGEYFKGRPLKNRINCCRVRISYEGVYLHSLIKLKGIPFASDLEITLWDFELITMKKCYINLKVEFIDGYAYKYKLLKFRKYYLNNYNQRLIAKKNKDDFNILYFKLLNNASYGKYLERAHNENYELIVNDEGIITSKVREKEKKKTEARYTYIPLGSCATAYNRVYLIETCLLLGWDKIVYVDTDSIFFVKTPETLSIWNSDKINKKDELGGWALEDTSRKFQATASKRYKYETTEGKTILHAGGINFDDYIQKIKASWSGRKEDFNLFDEVNITSNKFMVRRAFRCKGGTIIDFQTREVKVQKKDLGTYRKNVIINSDEKGTEIRNSENPKK